MYMDIMKTLLPAGFAREQRHLGDQGSKWKRIPHFPILLIRIQSDKTGFRHAVPKAYTEPSPLGFRAPRTHPSTSPMTSPAVATRMSIWRP